ncbi:hypothetical protein PBRA_002980 [Plasmodiophora brassicae]|uniref:Glutamine amidotransferase type-2 domain-containing protein n=1 Tax=Plasmodiophora brassicae TaxID=37360 RepID=A0A0G4J6N8_PLABS|nr:hypothetical protein PBRA_002980 [Plasmodiophora brassicae]
MDLGSGGMRKRFGMENCSSGHVDQYVLLSEWLCFQVDCTPCVFTSTLPAWNNRNLNRLCAKVSSPLVFAHVRAAGLGSAITETNCHPFVSGRYMFMHNGHIAQFGKLKRKLVASLTDECFAIIEGTTDSEHCFAVFMDELTRCLSSSPTSTGATPIFDRTGRPQDLLDAMTMTVKRLRRIRQECGITEHSYLNFAVTDGDCVVISRIVDDDSGTKQAASMYFSSGTSFKCNKDGVYTMAQRDRREEVVIVASERLTSIAEDWMEVPPNHIMVITPKLNVLTIAVEL